MTSVFSSGVGSSLTIYGTQWSAPINIVYLSESSGTCDGILCVPFPCTAKCVRELQEAKIVLIDSVQSLMG